MTLDEVRELRLSFVSAALLCQEGGLDGIEITACSGNLIQQFLSPVSNHRVDDYGGSFANRARFLFETIRAVRAAVGPDFVVGIGLGKDSSTPGAPGAMASELLAHLDSEQLIDYVELFEPTAPRPSGAGGLPRVLSGRCTSLDDAGALIAAGRADLVGFFAGPATD
jgi:2,4-dienoyl-CoA reductase (NADPH2)